MVDYQIFILNKGSKWMKRNGALSRSTAICRLQRQPQKLVRENSKPPSVNVQFLSLRQRRNQSKAPFAPLSASVTTTTTIRCEKARLKSLTNPRHSKPPLFFIKNLVAFAAAGVVFHMAYKNHSGNRIGGGYGLTVAVELEATMVEVVVVEIAFS
ncbi:hypothetical protein E3N88_46174 [Mikania micrantha]|uniref:Uncharacterized protein n=1 Tax=Mikania micrantha TaxID=192012 RepID=A0A5N6L6Z6_9ASTR|nr:hypothetical protein E3N88_46174 [Mikania micrantha]